MKAKDEAGHKAKNKAKEEADFMVTTALGDSIFMRMVGNNPIATPYTLERNLLSALDAYPEHLEALNLLAQFYARNGRNKEAMEMYIRLTESNDIEDDREFIEATLKVGEAYESKKQYLKAINIYELGLKKEECSDFYNALGFCWAKLSNIKKDLEYQKRAVALAPDNPLFLNDLGYAYIESGDFKEAEKLLSRAVALKPDYQLAKNNLAECRKRQQKRET